MIKIDYKIRSENKSIGKILDIISINFNLFEIPKNIHILYNNLIQATKMWGISLLQRLIDIIDKIKQKNNMSMFQLVFTKVSFY